MFDSAAACSAITVYPATLPPITTGTAYSQTFEQSGSSGTVVWGISAGTLPEGLTLDAASGVLSGIPTVSTYDFTVRATNGNCFGARYYTSKAVPEMTVTASINPVASGEPLTLTARVSSPDGATPTGTVRFSVSRYYRPVVPLIGGVASLDIIAPYASESGDFYVTASYSRDGGHQPSYDILTLQVY